MATKDAKEAPLKPGASASINSDEKLEWSWTYQVVLPVALFLLFVVCAGFLIYANWTELVDLLFESIEAAEYKVAQALVINTLLVIMIVCCLPGPGLMVMLDGFFFGFVRGFVLGFIAELIGYLICILLARTCFKAKIRRWITETPWLHEIFMVCEEDTTGKFLVLFRFVSLPVWAKNYTIGMLDISWQEAVLVFIPAETFYCGIFVYIGSRSYLVADAIRKGNTQKAMDSFSGIEFGIVFVSVLVVLLMIVFGWSEYSSRRAAIVEGRRGEASPLTESIEPVKAVV